MSKEELGNEVESLEAGQHTRGDDNKLLRSEKRRIELEATLLDLQLKRLDLEQKRVALELEKAKISCNESSESFTSTKTKMMGIDTMELTKTDTAETDTSNLDGSDVEYEEDSITALADSIDGKRRNFLRRSASVSSISTMSKPSLSCRETEQNITDTTEKPKSRRRGVHVENKNIEVLSLLDRFLTEQEQVEKFDQSDGKSLGKKRNTSARSQNSTPGTRSRHLQSEKEVLSMLDTFLKEHDKFKKRKSGDQSLDSMLVNHEEKVSSESGTFKDSKSSKRTTQKTEREVISLIDKSLKEQHDFVLKESKSKSKGKGRNKGKKTKEKTNSNVEAASSKKSEKSMKKKVQRRFSLSSLPNSSAANVETVSSKKKKEKVVKKKVVQRRLSLSSLPNSSAVDVETVSSEKSEKALKQKLVQTRLSLFGLPNASATAFVDCAPSTHSEHSAITELRAGKSVTNIPNRDPETGLKHSENFKRKNRSGSLPRATKLEDNSSSFGSIHKINHKTNKGKGRKPMKLRNHSFDRTVEIERSGSSAEPSQLGNLGVMHPSTVNSCQNLGFIVDNLCPEESKYQILNKPFVVFNPALQAAIEADDTTV